MSTTTTATTRRDGVAPTDIREFGHELWSYLTGKGAVIEYELDNFSVEVPQTTGPDSPRATWTMSGTLRIRTSDRDDAGSIAGAGA